MADAGGTDIPSISLNSSKRKGDHKFNAPERAKSCSSTVPGANGMFVTDPRFRAFIIEIHAVPLEHISKTRVVITCTPDSDSSVTDREGHLMVTTLRAPSEKRRVATDRFRARASRCVVAGSATEMGKGGMGCARHIISGNESGEMARPFR